MSDKKQRISSLIAVREHWCRPDEPILLSLRQNLPSSTLYQVKGFDSKGKPLPGLGRRALRATGYAAAATVLVVTTPSAASEPGNGAMSRSIPDLLVFGDKPDCAAISAIGPVREEAGFWVFTPSRLAFVVRQEEPGETQSDERRSLLGKVRNIGAELLDAVTWTDDSEIPPPPGPERIVSAFEFAPQHVSNMEATKHRLPRGFSSRDVHCLRVTLFDGSGFVFTTGWPDRALAMALGQQ
ncbi:hypothetical protein [Streptoalloteichus hindustanus]|uniref:Uncharacterized protein n=1 Tax=Streptoalloteichus hindustanus TaxID=2017 RepID=A0A1M5N8H7_STRHI|nr:hypothetical protein [Streptoalloteichus hindustanus]SHG85752.1 hypothetical protein SAMN05444320_11529 [Streptoalloteichus hindustanus]